MQTTVMPALAAFSASWCRNSPVRTRFGAAPFLPVRITLPTLRSAVQECRGCDLYKAATQDDPALGQRFIFITGDTANREAFSFLKDAGVLILEKPFQPTFFLDAVRRVTS